MNPAVVVAGGGISGLACAYRLQKLGVSVLVLEAGSHAGGLIESVANGNSLFESGPQSFQGTETLLGLIRELGIEGMLCTAPPGAPRYVLRHGKLQAIPLSPQALLTTSLLGTRTRLRIAKDAAGHSKPPSEEESVAAFVRRKFGHEILEYLVTPFVSGVYAGDPEKLSLRAAFPSLEEWEREHGSILRGAVKSRSAGSPSAPALCSFKEGLEQLPRAIADHLGAQFQSGAAVRSITSRGGSGYKVQFEQNGTSCEVTAGAVVSAVPAYATGLLVQSVSATIAKLLSGILYAPVAVVAHTYYTKQVGATLDGFGVLIPRTEKLRTLGIVWNSSLFPGRAPEGQVAFSSFLGGATDELILDKTDEEIAAVVAHDAAQILQITGSPISSQIWRHPKALPQYNLGHGHIVEAIAAERAKTPGLFLTGNYLEGPAIGRCVETAFRVADEAARYVSAP